MPLTAKQVEYLQNCNHRWNVKSGATGSGKSFVDFAAVIPKRILAARGEGLLVLLGNTRGTLERNILEPMRTIYPGLVSQIRSDNTVSIFGKRVYALGADNKKHVSRIQGATFEYVYGDEVTTWSEDVFQMLKSRLRTEHSHFDGTCNPASPSHWFKTFLDSDADIYQQSYVIDDGVLPEEIVTELKKEYAGTVYYDRYILGKWAEGLIYPMFDNVVEPEPRDYTEYYISMDYGILNATAMILWGLYDGVWYAIREYYHSGRDTGIQKTDEQYYTQGLVPLAGDLPIKAVIIDPSAASFIALIRQKRQFKTIGAVNDVLPGIQRTAGALAERRILVNSCCTNLIREFGLYVWADNTAQDEPLKENDHGLDALRYFVNTKKIYRDKRKYDSLLT